MDVAEALYRKYRPQVFGDVVGQEHIEATLRHAIEQDKVSHAYLFTGPRGTGKTTLARLLAKALLCQQGPTPAPDGTCEDCEMVAAGTHPDVYELDAASRTGVDNVREEIIGRVNFAPTRGSKKIYIIDEVHMLSTAAFNALLKTLEEPPSHVVFILCTTDPQKVPETIHSRCQRFDFRRIGAEGIVSRMGAVCMAEGVTFEGEALDLIAHRAQGGMRNALTSLEQLIAYGQGAVTLEAAEQMLGAVDSSDVACMMDALGRCDAAACFAWIAQYVETGADLAAFAADLADHIRNLYVMSLAGPDIPLEVSEAVRRELVAELPLFGPDRLARLLSVLGEVMAQLKTSANARLTFEIGCTRMVRPESELTLEALAQRIEVLERAVASGVCVTVPLMPADVQAQVASGAMNWGAGAGGGYPAADLAGGFAQPSSDGGFGASGQTLSGGVASPSAGGEDAQSSSTVLPDQSQARQMESQPARAASGGPGADAQGQVHASGAFAMADSPAQGRVYQGEPQPSGDAVVARGDARAQRRADAVCSQQSAADVSAAQGAAPVIPQPNRRAGSFDAHTVDRLWDQTLSQLKKEKAAYGALFVNTHAAFNAETGTLRVLFTPQTEFAFRAVQKPEIMQLLGQILARTFGQDLPFEYAKEGEADIRRTVCGCASAPATGEPAAALHQEAQPASQAKQSAERGQQPASQAKQSAERGQQPAAQSRQSAAQQQPVARTRQLDAQVQQSASQAQQSAPSGLHAQSDRPWSGYAQAEPAQQGGADIGRSQEVRPQSAGTLAGAGSSPTSFEECPPYDDEYVPYDDEYVPYDDGDDDPYADEPVRYRESPMSGQDAYAAEGFRQAEPASQAFEAQRAPEPQSAMPQDSSPADDDAERALSAFVQSFGPGITVERM